MPGQPEPDKKWKCWRPRRRYGERDYAMSGGVKDFVVGLTVPVRSDEAENVKKKNSTKSWQDRTRLPDTTRYAATQARCSSMITVETTSGSSGKPSFLIPSYRHSPVPHRDWWDRHTEDLSPSVRPPTLDTHNRYITRFCPPLVYLSTSHTHAFPSSLGDLTPGPNHVGRWPPSPPRHLLAAPVAYQGGVRPIVRLSCLDATVEKRKKRKVEGSRKYQ